MKLNVDEKKNNYALPFYHGKNKPDPLTMVSSEVGGLDSNHLFRVYLVYPEGLTFISITAFRKSTFEKCQKGKK